MIAGESVLDFTTASARVHAEIHAELTQQGQLIGADDLIIAATARHHGLSVLTDNIREFSRTAGAGNSVQQMSEVLDLTRSVRV